MIVVKASRIRSSNGSTVRIPDRPFVETSNDDSERLGIYLKPLSLNNQMATPEGYYEPLLYVYEKFVEITGYDQTPHGIREVSDRLTKRYTAMLYVPKTNDSHIFGLGAKNNVSRAIKMLRRYDDQGAYLALQGVEFNIRGIENNYPNDHWVYSFEDDTGYIQKGLVYGTQINLDAMSAQIRTKGSPNQVGIFVNAKNQRMKIRVFAEGVQFYGFTPQHFIEGHPQYGNPWPYVQPVIQRLAAI